MNRSGLLAWGVMRRVAVPLAVIAAVAVIGSAALRQPALPTFRPTAAPLALPARGVFPAVGLSDFEGLLVGQRGIPVVVNIWASWCAPCRTEMPLLQQAYAYTGRAVIVGVASKDDPQAAQAFLAEFGLTYPNVFDTTGEITAKLGLTAYPTTYVFGVDGKLRASVKGGISEQRLAALIQDALR